MAAAYEALPKPYPPPLTRRASDLDGRPQHKIFIHPTSVPPSGGVGVCLSCLRERSEIFALGPDTVSHRLSIRSCYHSVGGGERAYAFSFRWLSE
jgi:hypothetical protein